MKVTPILRTYVLATHRLLYHAQTKNAYTILDCTGAKDSEINQTILKAVEYYRTVQGSLVNVIRRTGQESPALHGFPSLKFNIAMRRVTQYRLAFNQSVGHTTLQICKIIYLVMIKKISLIISKLSATKSQTENLTGSQTESQTGNQTGSQTGSHPKAT